MIRRRYYPCWSSFSWLIVAETLENTKVNHYHGRNVELRHSRPFLRFEPHKLSIRDNTSSENYGSDDISNMREYGEQGKFHIPKYRALDWSICPSQITKSLSNTAGANLESLTKSMINTSATIKRPTIIGEIRSWCIYMQRRCCAYS